MKKYNVVVIFNKELNKTLMCKRTKEENRNPIINLEKLINKY